MAGRLVVVKGYFGGDTKDSARAREGEVRLSLSGAGMQETLRVEFAGQYGVLLPIRSVEQLAAAAREKARAFRGTGDGMEMETQAAGYHFDRQGRLRQGQTSLWFRIQGAFEMLSLEYARQGQISIPYGPVAGLIRDARRNLI